MNRHDLDRAIGPDPEYDCRECAEWYAVFGEFPTSEHVYREGSLGDREGGEGHNE